jgi:hypothetical protein
MKFLKLCKTSDFYLIFEFAININYNFFRLIAMMNQEDLFKKIGLILNELNSQYEFLAQNPQQLNELELALFHANADFLADHAKILMKVSKESEHQMEPTPIAVDRTEELAAAYYGDPIQEEQPEAEIC